MSIRGWLRYMEYRNPSNRTWRTSHVGNKCADYWRVDLLLCVWFPSKSIDYQTNQCFNTVIFFVGNFLWNSWHKLSYFIRSEMCKLEKKRLPAVAYSFNQVLNSTIWYCPLRRIRNSMILFSWLIFWCFLCKKEATHTIECLHDRSWNVGQHVTFWVAPAAALLCRKEGRRHTSHCASVPCFRLKTKKTDNLFCYFMMLISHQNFPNRIWFEGLSSEFLLSWY